MAHCILPYEAALHLGLFRNQGLDVSFLYLGPAPSLDALLNESVDFAATPIGQFVVTPPIGKTVVMVVNTLQVAGNLLLANPKSAGLQTLKDLAGRRYSGPAAPGSFLYALLWSALTRQGVDPAAVQYVPAPSGGCDQVAESDLDAYWVGDELCQTLLLRRGWKVLASFTSLKDYDAVAGGAIPFLGLLTRPDVLQKRPETVRKLARALVEAMRWLRATSGAKIMETLPQLMSPTDAPIFGAALDQYKTDFYSADGVIPPDSIQRLLDVSRAANTLPPGASFRAQDLFTNAYLPR